MGIGATTIMEKETKCTAAITTAYTIAKPGADDDTHSLAVAATDKLVGVFQHTTSAADERIRLMLEGISEVKLGDTVTRGDRITADSAGKGVTAVAGQNSIGMAMKSGVANDLIPVLLAPHTLSNAAGVNGHSHKFVATAIFDVAAQSGGEAAVGAYPLGVTIPDNAIITLGIADIITAFVSESNDGTIKLGSEDQDNDLLAAVDADTLSGIEALIPVGTAATMIKMTAARELVLTVAVHKLTAGKAVFFVEYVMSV
jgi:hypothetical protein